MARCLPECRIGRRPGAGALEPGDGFGVVGLCQVVREQPRLRVDQCAVLRGEDVPDPGVDASALALQHRLVRGLLEERVPEFVLIPGKPDQDLRGHQLVELGCEIDALVHELPEDGVVEDPPDRRRPLEQELELRVEPVQPCGQDPLQRRRHRVPGCIDDRGASCSA